MKWAKMIMALLRRIIRRLCKIFWLVRKRGVLQNYPMSMGANKGFTLIEISMVLIIIGLISGLIFIGRDLILIAQVRKQVSEIESYETAVHAFVNKYQCLPGDCDKAESLGLGQTGGPGENGNGDGELNGSDVDATGIVDPEHTLVEQEMINFWYHLKQASLVAGNYPGYTGVDNYIPGIDTPSLVLKGNGFGRYLARSFNASQGFNAEGGMLVIPIGESNQTHRMTMGNNAYPDSKLIPSKHAWYMVGGSNFTDPAGIYPGFVAYALDSKIDDGLPDSGKMAAVIYSLEIYLRNPPSGNGSGAGSVRYWLRNPIGSNEPQKSCINATVTPAQYRATQKERGRYIESLCSLVISTNF